MGGGGSLGILYASVDDDGWGVTGYMQLFIDNGWGVTRYMQLYTDMGWREVTGISNCTLTRGGWGGGHPVYASIHLQMHSTGLGNRACDHFYYPATWAATRHLKRIYLLL